MLSEGSAVHRCAVWGSPVAHSLSPVLHRAAYAALGLTDWDYARREVDESTFADALRGLDGSWRGLSLTMPLKEVGLRAARTVTPLAEATGAANTLVRAAGDPTAWTAHNTDVHGIRMALGLAGCATPSSMLVVGSGATARSALAAIEPPGGRVVFMVRDRVRAETLAQASAAGMAVEVVPMGRWQAADDVDAVVSTVPPLSVAGLDELAHPLAAGDARGPVVLDVVYGSGRTPLQRAAAARGWPVAAGTDMLLHQATEQVRLMTGLPAPLAAMSDALQQALAQRAQTAPTTGAARPSGTPDPAR
ncbi:shikimate dehydrogenase [Terrabacter terrigena]|uniref:Shikimate dehydrogenase n=1 Tax=Terrabacter terrigena TaxID=574718 RepID=A0ABW3MZD9_9MICO